jgi:hypothetical protein
MGSIDSRRRFLLAARPRPWCETTNRWARFGQERSASRAVDRQALQLANVGDEDGRRSSGRLDREAREAAGVQAGDTVDVAIELDSAPCEVEVCRSRLGMRWRAIRRQWPGLTRSRSPAARSTRVEADAKRDQTRARRVA